MCITSYSYNRILLHAWYECMYVCMGFFIHSRRFQEDHMLFMESLRQSLPLLAAKKILIVTDREFDFSDVFPLCLNVFCWNHLERDLHFYLKNSANCKSSEISFYASAFKSVMIEESEEEFNKLWNLLYQLSCFELF